jgi:FAD/FMN-containing dehydrogenase
MSGDWADDAPESEKKKMKQSLVEVSKALHDIVGPQGGTYMNEANPFEPYWQETFWGKNYPKLLAIKRKIDPKNLLVCNRCVGTDVILEP